MHHSLKIFGYFFLFFTKIILYLQTLIFENYCVLTKLVFTTVKLDTIWYVNFNVKIINFSQYRKQLYRRIFFIINIHNFEKWFILTLTMQNVSVMHIFCVI